MSSSTLSLQNFNISKIFISIITSSILILLLGLVHLYEKAPIFVLTSDLVAISKVPVYTGFFSQLGIFFWAGTTAVCLFTAIISNKIQNSLVEKRFFIFSGLFTLFLGFDDIFLFHEKVLPNLGMPEKFVYLFYFGLTFIYFLKFYKFIIKTDYVILLIALSLFGLSIVLDKFNSFGLHRYFWEDCAKMIGIVNWFFYFFFKAKQFITKNFVEK